MRGSIDSKFRDAVHSLSSLTSSTDNVHITGIRRLLVLTMATSLEHAVYLRAVLNIFSLLVNCDYVNEREYTQSAAAPDYDDINLNIFCALQVLWPGAAPHEHVSQTARL